jgi:hypothetical protein
MLPPTGTGMTMGGAAPSGREILFEFTIVGAAIRAVAIDSVTGIEVSIMGPANAARADLQQLLLRKLKARIDSQVR